MANFGLLSGSSTRKTEFLFNVHFSESPPLNESFKNKVGYIQFLQPINKWAEFTPLTAGEAALQFSRVAHRFCCTILLSALPGIPIPHRPECIWTDTILKKQRIKCCQLGCLSFITSSWKQELEKKPFNFNTSFLLWTKNFFMLILSDRPPANTIR